VDGGEGGVGDGVLGVGGGGGLRTALVWLFDGNDTSHSIKDG
jgi:hypothetical protein